MKSTSSSAKLANRGASPAVLVGRYVLILLAVLGVCSFVPDLSPTEVWKSFRGDGEGWIFGVWHDLRFKRLVFAAEVGALLGLAGTVFQAVLRNPLAEPYILGISGASALGAIIALTAGVAMSSVLFTIAPLVGAVAGTLLLVGLARWAGLFDPPSLILSGAVLNAIFGALILLFYALATEHQVVSSLLWLMGSIHGPVLGDPPILLLFVAVVCGCVGFGAVARYLDLLSLGEEEAQDLGLSAQRFRLVALVVASILTGIVVAFTGPIGFIGLVVPHITRRIHGPGHRRLVPLSMVGGAIFVMLCDTVARGAFDRPIPVGVVTALVGGPFFLVLLRMVRRRVSA